jgi:hypothetical protein
MALRNVGTKNPGIRLLVIQIISPLITIKNNPNVRIVTGIVRIIRIGFRIRFRIDSISATHNAEVKDATATPGINHAIPITASAINKNFVIRRMSYIIFVAQRYKIYPENTPLIIFKKNCNINNYYNKSSTFVLHFLSGNFSGFLKICRLFSS